METTAAAAYESLYRDSCVRLRQQVFLLVGQRHRAERCVQRAFQLAWNHWDEVAADPSPEGWVRATASGLALSPWRLSDHRPGRLSGRRHRPDHGDGGDSNGGRDGGDGLSERDRELLGALLRLPRGQRRALVLHDALGLTWEQTGLEVEASTPAAYGRVVRGRLALARLVPEVVGDDARDPGFGTRLGPLLRGLAVRGCPEGDELPAPGRVRQRAKLLEHGVNAAAGLATVAAVGGLAAGLVIGTPWHPSAPAFITYGNPVDARGTTTTHRQPTTPTAAPVRQAEGAAAPGPAAGAGRASTDSDAATPAPARAAAVPPLFAGSAQAPAAVAAVPAGFCGLFALVCRHHG